MALRRKLSVLLAVALIMSCVLGFSAPAFAAKGGEPTEGACGLGKESAHRNIENPESPGATEGALFPPSEFGCTGQE
jgi:hypothetical protein